MAEHVNNWLGAYLDGELQGTRLQTAEAHLETCDACRKELHELQKLAELFHEDEPLKTFSPAERFAANLTLQLPRLPEHSKLRKTGSSNGWLIPIGVTAAWIFVQTLLLINGTVSVLEQAGVLNSISAWLPEGVRHTEIFSTTMVLFGNQLGRNGQELLSTFDQVFLFSKSILTPIFWQAVIVLAYWAGMLAWFLNRNRQQMVGSKPIRT